MRNDNALTGEINILTFLSLLICRISFAFGCNTFLTFFIAVCSVEESNDAPHFHGNVTAASFERKSSSGALLCLCYNVSDISLNLNEASIIPPITPIHSVEVERINHSFGFSKLVPQAACLCEPRHRGCSSDE